MVLDWDEASVSTIMFHSWMDLVYFRATLYRLEKTRICIAIVVHSLRSKPDNVLRMTYPVFAYTLQIYLEQ